MEHETVVVFAGGPSPGPHLAAALPAGATVVAADRGAEHALALGLEVDLVVGDFDSVSPGALAELEARGARLERHPPDKDATDLELALDAAVALAPRHVLVVGAAAGRLDHLLGELLVLGAPAYAQVELDALLGRARVHVVRAERRLQGTPGELVSLFALHGPASGLVTDGLVYPLRGERLDPGSGRGVSNLFDAEEARVRLRRGVVLVLRPGERVSERRLMQARRSVQPASGSP